MEMYIPIKDLRHIIRTYAYVPYYWRHLVVPKLKASTFHALEDCRLYDYPLHYRSVVSTLWTYWLLPAIHELQVVLSNTFELTPLRLSIHHLDVDFYTIGSRLRNELLKSIVYNGSSLRIGYLFESTSHWYVPDIFFMSSLLTSLTKPSHPIYFTFVQSDTSPSFLGICVKMEFYASRASDKYSIKMPK